MKQALSSVEIAALISDLKKLVVGKRVINVYNIDSKCFLLKLGEKGEKFVIRLFSGKVFHLTDYTWSKCAAPSVFTQRLRDLLKNKRLSDIYQVNFDKIVCFIFGSEEYTIKLTLELYCKGNIILSNYQDVILELLRVREVSEEIKIAIGEKFIPHDYSRALATITKDSVVEKLSNLTREVTCLKLLGSNMKIDNQIWSCCLINSGLDPAMKLNSSFNTDDFIEKYMRAIELCNTYLDNIKKGYLKGGFIIFKYDSAIDNKTYTDFGICYDDSHAENKITFPLFTKAVDEYFYNIGAMKDASEVNTVMRKADKKVINMMNDHKNRIQALQAEQKKNMGFAELILKNIKIVNALIDFINSVLEINPNWSNLQSVLDLNKKENETSIANLVVKLIYKNKSFVIRLKEVDNEDPENIVKRNIEIFLDKSAHANAKAYFDNRRKAVEKLTKTVSSQQQALASVERRKKLVLKNEKTTTTVQKSRQIYWFENFFWFISSEHMLVVGGRDAQQNEQLVKKYMRKNDFFVHSELHGASVVIVRYCCQPNVEENYLPVKTLEQAGLFAVCLSSAWSNYTSSRAYWVYSHQVSKTPQSGEYLLTGSFVIRGMKNFMNPSRIALGVGLLFKISDTPENEDYEDKQDDGNIFIEDDGKILRDDDGKILRDDDGNIIKEDDGNILRENKEENNLRGDDGYILEENSLKEDVGCILGEDSSEDVNIMIRGLKENLKVGIGNECCEKKESTEIKEGLSENGVASTKYNDNFFNEVEKNQISSVSVSEIVLKSTSKSDEDTYLHIEEKVAVEMEVEKLKGCVETAIASNIIPSIDNDSPDTWIVKKVKGKKVCFDDEEREAYSKRNHEPERLRTKRVKELKKEEKLKQEEEKRIMKENRREISKRNHFVKVEPPLTAKMEKKSLNQESELLKVFVGKPSEKDVPYVVIPVCGPFDALQNYSFRVKISPGTMRRGQAFKRIIQIFSGLKCFNTHVSAIIKSLKGSDYSKIMPLTVKINNHNNT